jgi:hypothetical protein
MITMDHLIDLGKKLAVDNQLSSPRVIVEYGNGRGAVPLAEVAAEGNQQAMYEVGWQAARNERRTGRVEQMAVIAECWRGDPESGWPSADPNRQEALIISSVAIGKEAKHVFYSLKREADGRLDLSAFDPQPDLVHSALVEEFIRGYQDGQLALKRQRQKEAQLE